MDAKVLEALVTLFGTRRAAGADRIHLGELLGRLIMSEVLTVEEAWELRDALLPGDKDCALQVVRHAQVLTTFWRAPTHLEPRDQPHPFYPLTSNFPHGQCWCGREPSDALHLEGA